MILEQARRDKIIGSSLEGAIALSGSEALEADRAATGTAGLRPRRPLHRLRDRRRRGRPSPAEWRESQAYPGVRLGFLKARGRRCDRCWKVTPEADATGLCDRCRAVVGEVAA